MRGFPRFRRPSVINLVLRFVSASEGSLAKSHIAKTGNTARGMWLLMDGEKREQKGIA
jgi:hypothetical protein